MCSAVHLYPPPLLFILNTSSLPWISFNSKLYESIHIIALAHLLRAATCNGVQFSLFLAFGFVPWSRSNYAIKYALVWPSDIATMEWWRGVQPSKSILLGFSPNFRISLIMLNYKCLVAIWSALPWCPPPLVGLAPCFSKYLAA